MDEVIFQEFKGTGNTEIVLDRGLFERRIFPAMNIGQTGTRKEEKLLPPTVLPKIHTLRRALAGTDPMTAMKMLLERLQKFPSNDAFLKSFRRRTPSETQPVTIHRFFPCSPQVDLR